MDPHEVLGVAPDATEAEVRDAYRMLVRRHHPDRHVGAPADVQAAEATRMAEVTGAFQLLHDPAALARWKASQARVGRAPGTEHPAEPTTPRRPRSSPPDGGFDYRRAAASEFDEAVAGRWSRTPPTPPRPSDGCQARPPGGKRSGGSRWLNRLAWIVLLGMVVAVWVLGTDAGRNAWESLGAATTTSAGASAVTAATDVL